MKKLMIAVAVIGAAIVGNAASVNWSINDLQNSKGSTLTSGYVYTFSTKEGTYKTTADLTTALLAATTVDAFNDVVAESFSGMDGAVSAGTYSYEQPVASTGLTEGKKNTQLFAVIIDTATVTADTKWYVTEELSNKSTVPTTAAISGATFTIDDTGSHTSGNWHAIPEPTSGLLLLLGMAGLALRRKQK